jgi:hypothetical protein
MHKAQARMCKEVGVGCFAKAKQTPLSAVLNLLLKLERQTISRR